MELLILNLFIEYKEKKTNVEKNCSVLFEIKKTCKQGNYLSFVYARELKF